MRFYGAIPTLAELEPFDCSDIIDSIKANGIFTIDTSEIRATGGYFEPRHSAAHHDKQKSSKLQHLKQEKKQAYKPKPKEQKFSFIKYVGDECKRFYWEQTGPSELSVVCTNSNCTIHKRH